MSLQPNPVAPASVLAGLGIVAGFRYTEDTFREKLGCTLKYKPKGRTLR
jgi:hypothetical protein